MSKQEQMDRYDVVVLGGGPAGTATALSLRQHAPSLSVALIEQSNYSQIRIGETLSPIVQPLLEQLGVWDAFLHEDYVAAYGSCAAWGSDDLVDNEFIFHPIGRGWHLDRKRFDAMLAREAASKGVTVMSGSRFIASEMTNERLWRLRIKSENGLETLVGAAFVVDATGRRAVFANQQGADRVLVDQLLGVSIFYALNQDAPLTDTYTLVEAWEEGWWYSALVPNQTLAVVCMSDVDIVKKFRLSLSAEWLAKLQDTKHTRDRVRRAEPLGAPTVHAAYSHRLDQMTGNAWLAVGDAATTFDPLSSLGIFKGLRTGILASFAIGDYFTGSSSSLEKYEAILTKEFEEYLVTRADFYGEERRWMDSDFWRRRFEQITLDPRQLICLSDSPIAPTAIEKLSMHLPATDLKDLCRICAIPRQAQEVVSEFKARRSPIPDRRIILALQYLVDQGIIQHATG